MAQDQVDLDVSRVPTGSDDAGLEQQEPETLLTMAPEDVCQRVVEDWNESHKFVKNYIELGKLNRARELGYIGARLVKVQDESRFWLPPGASPNSGASMNKAARLKRRVRAQIFSDPPVPECTPFSDTDEDRDKAEFSTRALRYLCGPSGIAYTLKAGDAFDLGSNWGSGYIEFSRNPHGGGWVPQSVMVAPEAMQLTGATDASGMPVIPGTETPYPGDLVTKYVREDGSLTDDPDADGVRQVWRSSIEAQCHTLKNVRLIPSTASDIWDADGVMIGRMVPWGQLKTERPKLLTISEEERQKILGGRPEQYRELVPASRRGHDSTRAEDETLVFVLRRYHRSSPRYPKGCYVEILGTDYLCERGEWWDQRRRRAKLLPVTQFKQYQDGEPGENPNGVGCMTDIGPGNEARGVMLGSMFDHLDKFRKRKTFIPYTGNLRPEQLQSDSATYLPIIPGTEPRYEELPDFPSTVEKMYEMASADMDDASGLQQGGQAVNQASVKSGLHAQTIVEQINVLLSEPRQNTERALARGWEVVLQLAAEFDTPQQISWVSEDGAYKQQEWTGAEIGNTADVEIHKGSFTGLAPSAKAALTQSLLQSGLMDPEEARNNVTGSVGGLLGLQDNPARQRIRRQISAWEEGPPPDWAPPQPPVDPTTGQPAVDPNTGQPVPPPPDPVLAQIFAPRAPDEEPDIAKIRLYELGRAINSGKYNRWAQVPAWQQGIEQEYRRMRQAAGVQTVAEQQQAAQQQSQAQQQAAEAQNAVKREELSLKRDIEAGKLAVQEAKVDSATEQAALDRAMAPPPMAA